MSETVTIIFMASNIEEKNCCQRTGIIFGIEKNNSKGTILIFKKNDKITVNDFDHSQSVSEKCSIFTGSIDVSYTHYRKD